MELISENACTAVTKFRNALGNAALCAGGKKREQTCFGDSGGPLVHYDDGGARPVLIGVVSAGKKCGATGRPSQYTRIAAVKDWIASYVPAIR
jgi:secreted trypsin-like serine protease